MSDVDKKLSWRDAEIRDGFWQIGFVEEREGYHPSAEFRFRPMLAERMEAIEGKRERLRAAGDDDKSRFEVCKVLGGLVEWVRFGDGAEKTLDTEGWRRIRTTLQSQIYNIVIGLAEPDPRELSSNREGDDDYKPPADELGK